MKINQDLRSQMDSTLKNNLSQKRPFSSFDTVITSQSQKLKEEELHRLLNNIMAQGERVSRYRSFRDLAKYKRLVKDFVKEAVTSGLELKHQHSWTMDGRNRNLTVVDEVDQKLMELTETVLDQEKKGLKVLDIIGEIKGLLVNLYM